MPSNNDNNSKELVDKIVSETQNVKAVLRDLRYYIEARSEKAPEKVLEVLRERCIVLAESIKEYKVGKENSDKIQNVLEALNDVVNTEPQKLLYPGKDEFELYQDFGFTRKDYDDLLKWQKFLADGGENVDFVAAYDHFVECILKGGEKDPEDDWRNLIPAATGLIGIGSDIAIFSVSGDIITLYASSTNGILTIAASFKAVRNKLRKLFGNR